MIFLENNHSKVSKTFSSLSAFQINIEIDQFEKNSDFLTTSLTYHLPPQIYNRALKIPAHLNLPCSIVYLTIRSVLYLRSLLHARINPFLCAYSHVHSLRLLPLTILQQKGTRSKFPA